MVRRRSVAVRLPEELLTRIERYASRLSEAAEGAEITASEAIRLLIEKGLDVAERDAPKPPRRK